jgi:proton-dependent oligopeptide transporter, POT family
LEKELEQWVGFWKDPARFMSQTPYLTAPIKSERMPPGIPYIVGNEGAERFSYYGMRSILVIFMTQYLVNHQGQPDQLGEEEAKYWYHLFIGAVYFFPLFGAILAEAFLGKYRTIMSLSVVYCLGHLALAIDSTRMGLAVGLTLIAIGSGGIKPCVAANVGDQFGATNRHLIPKVFGWFYFAINFGSMISTLLIPVLLNQFGPHVAFGTPGLLMFAATWIFWLGRRKFVHIPPGGMAFVRETFSVEGFRSVGKLVVIYLFVAVFWSLYDQTSSAWVLQARSMDLRFMGIEWLPAQVHALNPILILIMIPLFTYFIYPAINRVFPLTPLRKITIGFFLAAVSFLIPAWIESEIAGGARPNIVWQLLAYVVITAAEVFVSITCLEFSYTQAPKKMKSLVMSIFNLSVFAGNLFTSMVNKLIQNPDGTVRLTGADYYLFFAAVMFGASVVFIVVAYCYREKTYIQDEAPQ